MALWNWFWRDGKGRVVLLQKPNWLLYGWAACWAIAFFISESSLNQLLSIVGMIFLTIWAVMEMVSGVTPARKTLGTIVFIATIISSTRML